MSHILILSRPYDVIFAQVAGRLHIELMRISGVVPERLCGGDDSSENSSESSCYEVMDTNGEIVHMAKRLTCRVENSHFFLICKCIKITL